MSEVCLGLDCTGETYSVGLSVANQATRVLDGFQPRTALLEIPAKVGELLDHAGLDYSDVTLVGVTQGPGSFTGVRLGVTFAKTMAGVCDCPVVGLDTLQVLAHQASSRASQAQSRVAVALDARRKELYCGVFEIGDNRLQVHLPTGVRPPQEFLSELEYLQPIELMIGAGFQVYPELIASRDGLTVWTSREETAPSASVICELALAAKARGEAIAGAALLEAYHRQADIQVSKSP